MSWNTSLTHDQPADLSHPFQLLPCLTNGEWIADVLTCLEHSTYLVVSPPAGKVYSPSTYYGMHHIRKSSVVGDIYLVHLLRIISINRFTLFSPSSNNASDTHECLALVTRATHIYRDLTGKLNSEVYLASLTKSTLHTDKQHRSWIFKPNITLLY